MQIGEDRAVVIPRQDCHRGDDRDGAVSGRGALARWASGVGGRRLTRGLSSIRSPLSDLYALSSDSAGRTRSWCPGTRHLRARPLSSGWRATVRLGAGPAGGAVMLTWPGCPEHSQCGQFWEHWFASQPIARPQNTAPNPNPAIPHPATAPPATPQQAF
jgi:hypothetical protein